jgi:hypothetical protein
MGRPNGFGSGVLLAPTSARLLEKIDFYLKTS